MIKDLLEGKEPIEQANIKAEELSKLSIPDTYVYKDISITITDMTTETAGNGRVLLKVNVEAQPEKKSMMDKKIILMQVLFFVWFILIIDTDY